DEVAAECFAKAHVRGASCCRDRAGIRVDADALDGEAVTTRDGDEALQHVAGAAPDIEAPRWAAGTCESRQFGPDEAPVDGAPACHGTVDDSEAFVGAPESQLGAVRVIHPFREVLGADGEAHATVRVSATVSTVSPGPKQ